MVIFKVEKEGNPSPAIKTIFCHHRHLNTFRFLVRWEGKDDLALENAENIPISNIMQYFMAKIEKLKQKIR